MKISVTALSSNREFVITAEIINIGNDILIIIRGGKEHIGAMSLSQYNQSINKPAEMNTSTSTLSSIGHKEEIVTRDFAQYISEKTEKNAAVVAGMHWDNLEKEELNSIMNKLDELKEKIIASLITATKKP